MERHRRKRSKGRTGRNCRTQTEGNINLTARENERALKGAL